MRPGGRGGGSEEGIAGYRGDSGDKPPRLIPAIPNYPCYPRYPLSQVPRLQLVDLANGLRYHASLRKTDFALT